MASTVDFFKSKSVKKILKNKKRRMKINTIMYENDLNRNMKDPKFKKEFERLKKSGGK